MDIKKTERLTMTVEEAGKALGISRATAYLLAKTGCIPVIRLGERRLVVPKVQLEKMLNGVNDGRDNTKTAST